MTRFLHNFFTFTWLSRLDFLAPLLLRLYLAPLFWTLGGQKITYKFSTDQWIAIEPNTEYAKKLTETFSFIDGNFWATFIGVTELIAGMLLIIGFFVRWISLPLMLIVSLGMVMSIEAGQTFLNTFEAFVMGHGDMSIDKFETLLMHFIMILSLFFLGAGRYLSFDWFIRNSYSRKIVVKPNKTVVIPAPKPPVKKQPVAKPTEA